MFLHNRRQTFQIHQSAMAESTDPNKEYTFQSPRRQNYVFRISMINFLMATSSNPNIYLKLSKSCKSLYAKYIRRRIFVFETVRFEESKFYAWNGLRYSPLSFKIMEEKKIKIWITDIFSCQNDNSHLASKLINHIYRFDGYNLMLKKCTITLEEFKHLTSSKNLSDVDILDCHISNPDGSIVSAEVLLTPLQDVEYLSL